jgi:hypothetical protein
MIDGRHGEAGARTVAMTVVLALAEFNTARFLASRGPQGTGLNPRRP